MEPRERWFDRMAGGPLGTRPFGGARMGGAFVWLLFIVFPLINAVKNREPAVQHAAAIVGAATFVAAYIALVMIWRQRRGGTEVKVLFAVLLAVACALTLAERPGWGFLFTYCAACSALVATDRWLFPGLVVCTALAGGTSLIAGASGATALSFVATTAGIGLLMMVMQGLRLRNEELLKARAEVARLAVADERERFARDLHDLLGHTLSVIALKAELAGRLLPERPEQAAVEVGEVEQVARKALGEVRDAVSGYHRPTLDSELAGARMALSAAGIEVEVQRPTVVLDPAVEAVLGWAVREGATNVVRHSGASRVVFAVQVGVSDAELEVLDDGPGDAGQENSRNGGGEGHGLDGLAERVQRLGGSMEAGARHGGGYRLAVQVPVGRP